mmetsp:Transcript_8089/g.23205  ORF Transcript_8089/g.23205 Transcript_8089/m.23205 type:complete len:244 (-) Transcript_8089:145-876(-)
MTAYNNARRMAGFPVDYELEQDIAELPEKRGKQLLQRAQHLVPQLLGYDAKGKVTITLNGVFYLGGGQDPFVLTTAHIIDWGGAETYKARVNTEGGLTGLIDMELLKAGEKMVDVLVANPQAHEYFPDVAVFKCLQQPPMLPPPMPAKPSFLGDICYILAYTGDRQLNFSCGMVSSVSVNLCTTTAYADSGFSGAPVVDQRGCLLGLVTRGHGNSNKQVSFLPVTLIQGYLVGLQLPYFPAHD